MNNSNLLKELENEKNNFTEEDYNTMKKIIEKTQKVKKEENVSKAETHKNEGNKCFKNQQYSEAVLSYTQAIEEDGNNAIYYSNRAAAYAKLNMKDNGIEDCKTAIKIDPNFVKAFIRLGDFYYEDDVMNAKKYYEQAIKIEPTNEMAKSKLKSCEKKEEKTETKIDDKKIAELLKNPEIMNMAKNLMKDKSPEEIENMMKNMFSDNKK